MDCSWFWTQQLIIGITLSSVCYSTFQFLFYFTTCWVQFLLLLSWYLWKFLLILHNGNLPKRKCYTCNEEICTHCNLSNQVHHITCSRHWGCFCLGKSRSLKKSKVPLYLVSHSSLAYIIYFSLDWKLHGNLYTTTCDKFLTTTLVTLGNAEHHKSTHFILNWGYSLALFP